MANRRRLAKRKAQAAERDQDARREQLARQRELRDEVKRLWTQLAAVEGHPTNVEIVTLASVEALVDQLVELQLIDRVRHNILTFEKMAERIKRALPSNGAADVPARETREEGAAV